MKGYQRSLLIDESPLQVLPQLAKAIGLNEAIILQQIHYWLNRSTNERDGHRFVYKTAGEWVEEFPFWSEATIKRALLNLRNRGLVSIQKKSEGSWDRTNWYSIHYDALNSLNLRIGSICTDASGQSDQMHRVNMTGSIGSSCADRSGQSDPMSNTTETTSETTKKTLCPLAADVFDLVVKAYPKRIGNDPLRKATMAWNARIREKIDPATILAGVQRYAAFCLATGKLNTEKVMMRATFFGPDKPFEQDFGLAPVGGTPAAAAVLNGSWWKTNEGVTLKGKNLGEEWPADTSVPGWFFGFSYRVFAKAGEGPWMDTLSESAKRAVLTIRAKLEPATA